MAVIPSPKTFWDQSRPNRSLKATKKWTATKSNFWKPFVQNTVIAAKFDVFFHLIKGLYFLYVSVWPETALAQILGYL